MLYIGYELRRDRDRNRQDFWFILLLMICLTFLFVREPIMKLFGFKYDYKKGKFVKL